MLACSFVALRGVGAMADNRRESPVMQRDRPNLCLRGDEMCVTLSTHEFAPGRRLYVAFKPSGVAQSGPICIWLCGGGLVRTNAVFLWLVLPRLARQGHVVVGPRYATSSPPLFTYLIWEHGRRYMYTRCRLFSRLRICRSKNHRAADGPVICSLDGRFFSLPWHG